MASTVGPQAGTNAASDAAVQGGGVMSALAAPTWKTAAALLAPAGAAIVEAKRTASERAARWRTGRMVAVWFPAQKQGKRAFSGASGRGTTAALFLEDPRSDPECTARSA